MLRVELSRWRLALLGAVAVVVLFALPVLPLVALAQGQATDPPGKPTNLTGTVTHDAVSLTWDAPADSTVTGYVILRLRREVDQLGNFHIHVENTGNADTAYTDRDVEAEARYVYRVQARNGNRIGERSNFFNANLPAAPEPTPTPTPTPTPQPEPPQRPTGLTGAIATDRVSLSWDDPGNDDITGYRILRLDKTSDTPDEFSVLVDDTASAATSYTDTDVAADGDYIYRVQARNGDVLSAQSKNFNARMPEAVPRRPRNLTASATHDAVTLQWDDPGDNLITGYQILRRQPEVDEAGTFHVHVDDTASTDTTYVDTTVTPDTAYVYRVKSRNNHVLSKRSNYVNLRTPARDPALKADAGVSVSKATLTVPEGGNGQYTVVLDTEPTADVTITVSDRSANPDVTVSPTPLTFGTGDWNIAQAVTVSAAHDVDIDNDVAVISHTAVSTDTNYSGITIDEVAVTITDDDAVPVVANFGAATYTVAEGAEFTITVNLDQAPMRTVSIPLRVTYEAGATKDDHTDIPTELTFESSDIAKDFKVTAVQDTEDDNGEGVRISLGTLPPGVTAGGTSQTLLSITDDDVQVGFRNSLYAVDEGDNVEIEIVLSEPAVKGFTVRLSTDEFAHLGPEDYSGVPLTVTFTAGDESGSFHLTVVEDDRDDLISSGVEISIEDLPDGVTLRPARSTIVLVRDNDTASLQPGFHGPLVDDPREGQTVRLGIFLHGGWPESEVTIPIMKEHLGGADASDYSGIADSYTFAPYETFKEVYFKAIADDVDDDNGHSNRLIYDGERVRLSFGTLPDGLTAPTDEASTTIKIHDADFAQILAGHGGSPVIEGVPFQYPVWLSSQPSADVTVSITSGDPDTVSVSPSQLIFTQDSWSTPQNVTVTAAHDDDATDPAGVINIRKSATGGGYDGLDFGYSVAIMDDEKRGVWVSQKDELAFTGPATVTYQVRLTTQPTGDVTVTPASSKASPAPNLRWGTVDTSGPLVFTTENWRTPQSVTVDVYEAATTDARFAATISHTVAGADYETSGVTAPGFTITVKSDFEFGVEVLNSHVVREGQGSFETLSEARFIARHPPKLPKTFTITSQTGTGFEINYYRLAPIANSLLDYRSVAEVLRLNPEDFVLLEGAPDTYVASVTQPVEIIDDDIYEGDEWFHLDIQDAPGIHYWEDFEHLLKIVDNDPPGANVAPLELQITEEDATGTTYQVVMRSRPVETATITVASSDPTVSVSPNPLNFTPSNWNIPQSVTVTAGHDDDSVDNLATITHQISGARQDRIPVDSVAVTVLDNDPGVNVNPSALTVAEGDTAGSAYTVRLNTQPSATVTVTISGHEDTDASVDDATLVFTTTSWNEAQTVTVTGASDDDAFTDTLTLTHTPSGGDYAELPAALLSVAIREPSSVEVHPTELFVIEAAESAIDTDLDTNTAATYTVSLKKQPSGPVGIFIKADDQDVVTVHNKARSSCSHSRTGTNLKPSS